MHLSEVTFVSSTRVEQLVFMTCSLVATRLQVWLLGHLFFHAKHNAYCDSKQRLSHFSSSHQCCLFNLSCKFLFTVADATHRCFNVGFFFIDDAGSVTLVCQPISAFTLEHGCASWQSVSNSNFLLHEFFFFFLDRLGGHCVNRCSCSPCFLFYICLLFDFMEVRIESMP